MKTTLPSFTVEKLAARIIGKIAHRATSYAEGLGIHYPLMDAEMDITATHANGNPLRLDDLLHADDFNFAHDVFGIRRHIDRNTGQLQDCFVPRFSERT